MYEKNFTIFFHVYLIFDAKLNFKDIDFFLFKYIKGQTLNAKEMLFNDVVALERDKNLSFPKSEADTTGVYMTQVCELYSYFLYFYYEIPRVIRVIYFSYIFETHVPDP